MKKLNILVIGGTGFLGSNLVNALAQEKHNIKVLSRGHIKLSENYSNVKYIIGDICDEKSLNRAIKDTDFVYHLASTTNPKFGEEDLLFDLSSNLISTINILKNVSIFMLGSLFFAHLEEQYMVIKIIYQFQRKIFVYLFHHMGL